MREQDAVDRIRLGESLASIAGSLQEGLCRRDGIDPGDEAAGRYTGEVADFMRSLCRHLGDRHAGERRIAHALVEWVERCPHYEAWDALLSGFEFDARPRYLRRGKQMFPGPLTAHWS